VCHSDWAVVVCYSALRGLFYDALAIEPSCLLHHASAPSPCMFANHIGATHLVYIMPCMSHLIRRDLNWCYAPSVLSQSVLTQFLSVIRFRPFLWRHAPSYLPRYVNPLQHRGIQPTTAYGATRASTFVLQMIVGHCDFASGSVPYWFFLVRVRLNDVSRETMMSLSTPLSDWGTRSKVVAIDRDNGLHP